MNMTEAPKISILIPAYNVEDFVEEAVISILRQTYLNIEVIVVDDCSTDNTYSILERLSNTDNRLLVFKNEFNMKIAETLNAAFKFSTGEYIARMDADDIAMPDRLEKQLKYIFKTGVDLVGCSLKCIDTLGNGLHTTFYSHDTKKLEKALYYGPSISHIWLAKRCVYEKVGDYRASSVEDYDFLLRTVKCGFKISNVPNYIGMKIRKRNNATIDLYGLSQRRIFNYIRKVNFSDSKFSDEYINTISEKRNILDFLHDKSNKLLKLGVKRETVLIKYLFYFLSSLISPYQAQYFTFRLMQSLIMSKDKSFSGFSG